MRKLEVAKLSQMWSLVIFGLPITAIFLVVIGLLSRTPWLVVIGAIVALPFTWYLATATRNLAWILSTLLMVAAFALHRGSRRTLPALLVLPYAGVIAWLAYVVLSQPSLN